MSFFLFIYLSSIEWNQIYDDDPLPNQICNQCDSECSEVHRKIVRMRQREEYWTSELSENDPFKRILAFRKQQDDELQKKIEQILSNNVSNLLSARKSTHTRDE